MAVSKCPSCQAQVLPGDVACRRCGFDFILGKNPAQANAAEARKRMGVVVAAGVAAALLVLGGVLLLRGGGVDEPAVHPCESALAAVQPLVAAAKQRGNPIRACAETPPGAADCWGSAGVHGSWLEGPDGIRLSLKPTKDGFELLCTRDADADGRAATWKANERSTGVRISASDVN